MIIDVSVHNGTLNWEQLKGRIEAAIIRCGYGQNLQKQDDKQFLRNVTECERLGIPYGLYLYSYAGTEAEARGEAQHVKRLLNGRRLTLPVFYDLEESGKGYMARKNFYAFEEEMGSAARVGLYTGEYYYNTYLHGVNAEIRWIAKYGTNNGRPQKPPVLSDGRAVDLWQYTSEAMGGHMDASQIINREKLFRGAAPAKSVDELAQEVIAGKYGTGDARKAALGSQYEAVQKRVNELLSAPAVGYTVGGYKLNDVKYGDKGETVRFLQTLLNSKHYECGAADGIAGDKTLHAIAQFQADKRQTVCGEGTWRELLK